MEISKIKLINIEPADYNPRTITEEAKKKLRNSIETFGLVEPIIINTKNNRIIGGHQRYQILLDMVMEDDNLAEKEYDYLIKDDYGFIFDSNKLTIENEDYEKALNIVLNNTNLMGDYDYQKLEGLLTELEFNGFNLEFTGFEGLEINSNLFDDNFNDFEEYEIEEFDGNFDDGFVEDETYIQEATFELHEGDSFDFQDFEIKIKNDMVNNKIRLTVYQDTFRVTFDNFSDEDLLKLFIENNSNARERLRDNGKLNSDIYG